MKLSTFSAVFLLATSTLCSAAAPTFKAVDMGLFGDSKETSGFDLNDRNVAIGYADDDIFWTKSAGTRHTPEPTPASSSMRVLNNVGSMAGLVVAKGQRKAVVVTHRSGYNFFLDGTWAADSLQDFPIRDISNKGEILGRSAAPWLWSETLGLRAIDDPEGVRAFNRLNDAGLVVGNSDSSDSFCFSRAFVYESRSKRFTPLDGGPPMLDEPYCGYFSDATALNNKGQVVGHSNLCIGLEGQNIFGFIWSRRSGFVQLSASDSRMVNLMPLDINDKGQVVGTFRYIDGPMFPPYRYFYWDAETGAVDLQTLLDPQDPLSSDAVLWDYYSASPRINNKGTIMVTGKLRSQPPPRTNPANRTFILLAQPE